jgi:hypothetical protein
MFSRKALLFCFLGIISLFFLQGCTDVIFYQINAYPILQDPADETVYYVGDPITLEWTHNTNLIETHWYLIYLDDVVIDTINIDTIEDSQLWSYTIPQAMIPPKADEEEAYVWKIEGRNEFQRVLSQTSRRFFVYSLSSPDLLCDTNDYCGSTAQFNWNTIAGALSYEYQLDTTDDFSNTEPQTLETPPLDIAIGSGLDYWLRIRSVRNSETSEWITCSFSTVEAYTPVTQAETSHTPENLCEGEVTTLSYPVMEDHLYSIRIKHASDSEWEYIESGEATGLTDYSLSKPGSYTWEIKSITTCMDESEVSFVTAETFEVNSIPLTNLDSADDACVGEFPVITFSASTGLEVQNVTLNGETIDVTGDSATYSGPALSPGDYSWTWEREVDGCIAFFSDDITINDLPETNLDTASNYCETVDPEILFQLGTGSDVTNLQFDGNLVSFTGDSATYTGGGLSAGTSYDWTWDYSSGGCTQSFIKTISITAAPTSNLQNADDTCINEDPMITFDTGTGVEVSDLKFNGISLTVIGDSATYTGGGLVAGNPYDWTWTRTLNGCSDSFLHTVTILDVPSSNLLNASDACFGTDPSITFVGGTGINVSNLEFDGNLVSFTGDSATYTGGGLSAGTSYDWTWDYTSGGCTDSFLATMTVINPSAPSLSAVGPFCETEDVILSWSDESADTYDVQWDDASDFLSIVGDTNTTTTTYTVGTLSQDVYYYRVRQNKSGCTSDWSDTTNYSFSVSANPTSPASGSLNVDGDGCTEGCSISFEFDDSGGYASYQIEYVLSTGSYPGTEVSGSSSGISASPSAGEYMWRIRANDGTCVGTWVDGPNFTIVPAAGPPASPTLSGNCYTLSWAPVANTDYYIIDARCTEYSSIPQETRQTGTTYSIDSTSCNDGNDTHDCCTQPSCNHGPTDPMGPDFFGSCLWNTGQCMVISLTVYACNNSHGCSAGSVKSSGCGYICQRNCSGFCF